jgi:halocyanin-like protein
MARNRPTPTRRTVLKTGGALALGGLVAGCTGGSGTSGSGGDSGGGSGDTANGAGGDPGSDSGSGSNSNSASGTRSFGGWLESSANYDGVADETGEGEVTVEVGTEGNSGSNAFSPAAIEIDAGTTVVWEWTGKGASHNVVASDGAFESDYYSESGATFEYTFEEAGTYKYYCTPHKSMGMKGVVVVE